MRCRGPVIGAAAWEHGGTQRRVALRRGPTSVLPTAQCSAGLGEAQHLPSSRTRGCRTSLQRGL